MARSTKRDLWVIVVGITLGAGVVFGLFASSLMSSDLAGELPRPSAVQPQLGLTTTTGEIKTLRSLHGDYALVSFGFTQCPDVCPSTLIRVSAALDRLGPLSNRIESLFITLDPQRDTAKRLRQYTQAFDPRIEGLRGSPVATEGVAASFGVHYERIELDQGGYTLSHTAAMFVLGPKGDCLAVYPYDRDPEALASDIRNILTS